MSRLKKDLHEAAQIVQRNSLREQTRHAKLYNRKVKGSPLVVGDRVLIANRGVPGKRKVADKWESTPYEVMSVKPDINVYRVKDTLTGRERVVHRNLLLSVSFLPCERGEDLESAHSGSDFAAHGSDLCSDVPNAMEDSDVRTVKWLMQTGDGGIHSGDDDDSLDLGSDAAQSDSLMVDTSSQASHPVPAHDIVTVDGVEDSSHCPDDMLTPDTDMTPPSAARPDMSPPGDVLTDLAPVDSSPDIKPPDTDAPERAIPDGGCSETCLPGSLPQIDSMGPARRVLRDRGSIRPPRRLICEMNDQAIDEDSISTVSVGSLIQFFSSRPFV